MHLKVPLIKQPKNSSDCGLASIAMIFEYYKIPKTFDDIKKEIKNRRYWIHVPELWSYLIENGFEVELITINPRLFTAKDQYASERNIRRIIFRKRVRSRLNKVILRYMRKFIKAGGKVSPKILEIKDITTEIKEKRPMIALIIANFLNSDKPSFNLHFNVITGYDKDHIYANDPLWDKRGWEKKYKKSDFLYSIFASVGKDIDTATLIKIRKK